MFFGLDGNSVWFTGVVEDRLDPLKIGRVRVRLHVHHCKEKVLNQKTGNGIKTEELPWAYVMSPVTSPSMDGIGTTPLIVEGTHVVGFSRDGNTLNDLVIIGTIGGMPEDAPNIKLGFSDPRTPGELADTPRYDNLQNYPQSDWLKKSNLNRLHRVEQLDRTYLEDKKQLRKTGIKNILGGWDELPSSYAAQYPYNQVTETECGHVIELDDTKLNERYGYWHGGENAKGSYFEFFPDGSYVLKAKLDIQVLSESFSLYAKKTIKMSSDDIGISSEKTISLDAKTVINIISKEGVITVASVGGLVNVSSTIAVNVISPIVNLDTRLLTINKIPFYVG